MNRFKSVKTEICTKSVFVELGHLGEWPAVWWIDSWKRVVRLDIRQVSVVPNEGIDRGCTGVDSIRFLALGLGSVERDTMGSALVLLADCRVCLPILDSTDLPRCLEICHR